MYFIIYKTTNIVNGKFYIGKHQTNNLDDGYVGSGKLLKRAIKKYGKDNFITEIIDIYDQEWQMNLAEKIYVVIDKEVSYNLCSGGKGGFSYINENIWTDEARNKHNKKIAKNKRLPKEVRLRVSSNAAKMKNIKYNDKWKEYWTKLYDKYKMKQYKSISEFIRNEHINHCSSVISRKWKQHIGLDKMNIWV